ncbi:hypothetical protein F480_03625 [Bibersteinia trehalosi Y31]|uniref:Transferrin-binding protein B C-lobe/N-lobe beta barrel domain-containing protein n=1 Tax=Bibersteinia trehalosi Y31 TaxID=1261658 RepID=A0A179D0X9_BIBTR|nr:hypothetical protein [Bibersteinia trehalosi]OAQ15825.1 hypothetical protein F480_03625 [Bibersteinia trehalosi Y31]
MKRQFVNGAMALLIALGVSACSVNAGGGSQGDPVIRATSSATNTNTSANTNENSDTETSEDNTLVENRVETTTESSSTEDSSKDTTTDEPSHTTTENVVDNIDNEDDESELIAIGGVGVMGSQAEKYLTSLSAQDELFASINKMENVATGSCSNSAASGSKCAVANAQEGDILAVYTLKDNAAQTLAGYAVIREAYTSRENPTNSYITLLSVPTTEKSAVVNATYTGKASLSYNNSAAINTMEFEMTASNDTVSGKIYTIANTGKESVRVTLNSGDINVTNGLVGFNGTTTFNKTAYADLADVEGVYQGWFVGENAEGVIGTIHTKNQTSSGVLQGAFAGTK